MEEVNGVEAGLMQDAQRFFVLTQTDNLWKDHLQAIKFVQQVPVSVCLSLCCVCLSLCVCVRVRVRACACVRAGACALLCVWGDIMHVSTNSVSCSEAGTMHSLQLG